MTRMAIMAKIIQMTNLVSYFYSLIVTFLVCDTESGIMNCVRDSSGMLVVSFRTMEVST